MGIALRDIRREITLGLRGESELPGMPESPVVPEVCGRVFANRVSKIQPGDLPAIRVWTLEETGDVAAAFPREYLRKVELTIELVTADSSKHEGFQFDNLDEMGQLIEDFMAEVELPGVGEVYYRSFKTGAEDDAATPIAVGAWVYELEYTEQSPRGGLEGGVPLERIGMEYDLAGTSAGNEAEDLLELEQQ